MGEFTGTFPFMYSIVARLASRAPVAERESTELRQVINEGVTRNSAVQHVYSRPGESGMDLVLFVVAATVEAAEAEAQSALKAALTVAQQPFEIASCAVDLLVPVAEAMLKGDQPPAG